jgi:hypothetical protein
MADYARLLRDRITLTCRSVDRMFFQAYVPKLQSPGLCARFLLRRGYTFPSSAAFGIIGRDYVQRIHGWAEQNDVPVIQFKKRENKEERARPFIEAAAAKGGGSGCVALIGIAQEKASVWKSWKQKGTEGWARPQMQWSRQQAFPNHFYFYIWDPEFGPAFWKTNAYAPWPVWIYLNGHEWAKRQLDKLGVGYTSMDNGFSACEDQAALQRVCDRLGPGAVKSFFWRWQQRLPSPFTPREWREGYIYELAFRQIEFADTRVFDRPQSGRAFFEAVIRDHLDVGRPDQVAIIFGRRVTAQTPGAFRTKVIRQGVDPQLSCYYRSSRLKQYFKNALALRTEMVICDTYDFGIGRRVNAETWHALRAAGEAANARLCAVEASDASPAPDVVTLQYVTRPSTTVEGQHAPGMRFGDPRVMALFAALCGFCHLVGGLTNRLLTEQMQQLYAVGFTSRQTTYDLRRLLRKGLLVRRDHTQRYDLTPLGRRVVVLFTKTHARVLSPGLAWLDPDLPADIAPRGQLAVAWRRFDKALDTFIGKQMLAA